MTRNPEPHARSVGASTTAGSCPSATRPRAGTLAASAEGCSAVIMGFSGERDIRTRVESIGLVPGVEVEVVSNCSGGPLLISLEGSRLTLGRSVADSILVA